MSKAAFTVNALPDRQVELDGTASLALGTTGSLSPTAGHWTARSSNRSLVPNSGLSIRADGSGNPFLSITSVSGQSGSTTITVLVDDGEIAAASTFVLTVGSNHPPLAVNDSAQHPPGNGVKIETRKLLLNDSDPDGDLFSLTGLSATSAHGGGVRLFGPFVAYTPPASYDGPDFFTYTITDSHGASAIATVSLTTQPVSLPIPITVVGLNVLPNGNRQVAFIGIPNLTYTIQASADLSTWITVGSSTSDNRGSYLFEDANTDLYPTRFYRSVYP